MRLPLIDENQLMLDIAENYFRHKNYTNYQISKINADEHLDVLSMCLKKVHYFSD